MVGMTKRLGYRLPLNLKAREASPFRSRPTYHIWYMRDDEAVAYGRFFLPEEGATVELLEVEVRPSARGEGLVRRLFEEVQGYFGKPLEHRGQYTEDGMRQVAPYFNSKAELEVYPEWAATPENMYVKSWGRLTPRHK